MPEFASPDYSTRLLTPAAAGGLWHRRDVEPFLPRGVAIGRTVDVQVNHGRWIVECEHCSGAQFAVRGDTRFFCVDCLNEHVSGQWITVVWPTDVDRIDGLLVRRPRRNQNWTPDETVDQLIAENADNKVDTPRGKRPSGLD